MIEVKKRNNESTESLLRRFSKRVQQSGVLLRAKKRRFYEPPKNKRAVRSDALRRAAIREEREVLRKLGKLEEFDMKKRGHRSKPLPRIPRT
ncbi:MAG: 30S ribosomal protein S21 [Candidatus Kerfeldbacteria bacterium]|nr:30S ribosomal protein S21 [Candidatus Kerfeldbacteria bacterium]